MVGRTAESANAPPWRRRYLGRARILRGTGPKLESQAGLEMTADRLELFDCDLCGSSEAEEIAVAHRYTDGQPIHVCKGCGFVYVRRRRSAARIADDWSDELYKTKYTARIPAIKARHVYVAEFIDTTVGLKDKALCDIGGGEGQFAAMIRAPEYGARVFAIEPSAANCQRMRDIGIESFTGTIEDYVAAPEHAERKFDIVTIMWTLENCQSCRGMLEAAHRILAPGGHIVLATGSRILVPFKKPLGYYLGPNPADTHAFRFSANTLNGLLAVSGFEAAHVNRYIDSDILCVVAARTERAKEIAWEGDDWREVVDFFERWAHESEAYYADA